MLAESLDEQGVEIMAKFHKPTIKAKKAYYKNIREGYKRLRRVLKKHDPQFLKETDR